MKKALYTLLESTAKITRMEFEIEKFVIGIYEVGPKSLSTDFI